VIKVVRAWISVITGLAAMAVVAACTGNVSTASSPSTLHPGTSQHTLTWAGERRTYLLHRPTKGGTSPPLVVILHGATVSAEQTERYYHWDDLADTQQFAVAYPQGIDDAWNAGSCCGDAPARGTDDVGFLGAVLNQAANQVGADPARIYLAGVSNGAMMTIRFACERPGLLAAIGSVAGTLTSRCDHLPAVPFIEVHGLNDRAVRFQPGSGTVESGPEMRLPGLETIDRFLAADGCHDPVTVSAGPVHTQTAPCAARLDVKVITIDGAGHQWPGATLDASRAAEDGPLDQPSRAADATRELWDFFAAHQRP
jgi:polyhydroxybutyrate depolymerase